MSIGASPATHPATSRSDAALWSRLIEIDSRAARVKSLSANFDQQKFTAILRKPLVSSGRVRIQGSTMRWDTNQPERSVLLIDPHEARVYYPAHKMLEVYPLAARLGELAASPLPRLDALKEHFTFEQIPVAELDKSADAQRYLALSLTPADPTLREHVKQVRVLLEIQSAIMIRAEMTDSDGDRTALSFRDVQLNANVGDLNLAVPRGTAVTHPLEGLGGSPAQDRHK